jgi:uncharacterized protein (DUF362 family)
MHRRDLLRAAAAAGAVPAVPAPPPTGTETPPPYKIITPYKPQGKMGAPGLYPGQVVEVASESSIDEKTDRINREVLRKMVERGMRELTGARTLADAWKTFFAPGDRVAIKVNASGAPQCVSSPELVLEVIAGLTNAGVKTENVWIYERYAGQVDLVGYEVLVPDGVHVMGGERRRGELTPYDRDVYVEVDFFGEEDTRSYMSEVVTKRVDKIINIANVKDHSAGGATGCLKNIAYGSFNNVARSHSSTTPGPRITHARTFIGTLAAVEPLRSKTVLHIMDGLRGVWNGGPAAFTPEFLWYPKFLQFGTDPVAIDRLLLDTIENKRKTEGAVSIYNRDPKLVGKSRQETKTSIGFREPWHVHYAGSLGLGTAEIDEIKRRRFDV